MTRLAIVCLATLAFAGAADAHALDEYVQAVRVGVSAKELAVYLDLTPGMNIAADVLRRVDSNGDGVLSPTEAEAYGRSVIADVSLTVDGHRVPLSLVRVELPPRGEMMQGQAAIRVEASAAGATSSGRHRVMVLNRHLPAISVYLANALLPETASIRILRQTRDVRQQTYWLDYEVRSGFVAAPLWALVGGTMLTTLVLLRTREGRADI